VLIVGGSSGIGYAIAEACLEHGMLVYIASSQQPRIDTALGALSTSYPTAKSQGRILGGHPCNLADPATIETNIVTLLATVTDHGKTKLNHIIHTAGDALGLGALANTTFEKIQKAGLVRFYATQLLAKHVPKYVTETGSLTITTGSVSEKPQPGWSSINGFATGIHGLARGLALDLKPIRVNAVSPGVVNTSLFDSLPPAEKEEMFKGIERRLTTGKIAQAEDVAEAYVYLLKDNNITGTIVRTDGGYFLTCRTRL
jgi:NAD(P)-dependent dehydrogenase (short-subunit alcohol dehydrogenase family)